MAALFDITLDLEKETKGAVRYAERGTPESHRIGTIYVRKTAFKDGQWPRAIKVVVNNVAVDK